MVSHGLSSQHNCTNELTIKARALFQFFGGHQEASRFSTECICPVGTVRPCRQTSAPNALRDRAARCKNTSTTSTYTTHEDVINIDQTYFTYRSALIPHVWQKWQNCPFMSFHLIDSGFFLYINFKLIKRSIRCPQTKAKVAHATKMPLDLWKVETFWNLIKLPQISCSRAKLCFWHSASSQCCALSPWCVRSTCQRPAQHAFHALRAWIANQVLMRRTLESNRHSTRTYHELHGLPSPPNITQTSSRFRRKNINPVFLLLLWHVGQMSVQVHSLNVKKGFETDCDILWHHCDLWCETLWDCIGFALQCRYGVPGFELSTAATFASWRNKTNNLPYFL